MPAQLDTPRPGPQPSATGWTLLPGQEVRGFCFGLSSHPHLPIFSFPLFCLLVWHWGWGLLQLAGFQTLELIVPSPEQKSRRGSPSTCHISCFHFPEGLACLKSPPASSGEARADPVLKGCPALQLAAGRGVELPVGKGQLGLLPLLLSRLQG